MGLNVRILTYAWSVRLMRRFVWEPGMRHRSVVAIQIPPNRLCNPAGKGKKKENKCSVKVEILTNCVHMDKKQQPSCDVLVVCCLCDPTNF